MLRGVAARQGEPGLRVLWENVVSRSRVTSEGKTINVKILQLLLQHGVLVSVLDLGGESQGKV